MRGETITFQRIDDNEIKVIQDLFHHFHLEIGDSVSVPQLNERKRRTRSSDLEDSSPSILPPSSPNDFSAWVKVRIAESLSVFGKYARSLEKEIAEVDRKVEHLQHLAAKAHMHAAQQKMKVNIDVGGEVFSTCRDNLLKFPDSYFYGMINSGVWKPDEEGNLYNLAHII